MRAFLRTITPDTRGILAVLATVLFATSYMAPWVFGMPKGAEQYIGQAQGAVITGWIMILSWYFGSSKSGDATKALAASAIDKLPPATPTDATGQVGA